jgi:hypothetical protein
MRLVAVWMFLLGCETNEKEVKAIGGQKPIACTSTLGSGSDEDQFTSCRDAAGVIFVCNTDAHVRCIRIQRVQATWSAGLPEARP